MKASLFRIMVAVAAGALLFGSLLAPSFALADTLPDAGGGAQTGTIPNAGGGAQTGVIPNAGGGAQIGNGGSGGVFTISNPLHAKSIGEIVLDFATIFSYVVVLLAVLVLIWIGFQYVMASAQGNADKIKELHSHLLWVVVGIAVVIGARIIVQVVVNTLTATGTVNSNITNSVNDALHSQ